MCSPRRGVQARIFIDHEVGGLAGDAAGSRRPVQMSKLFGIIVSPTDGKVAIPSFAPVNPSCSVVVVALTFTRFKSHCRSAASTAHMASIGAILGAWAMMVTSRLPMA